METCIVTTPIRPKPTVFPPFGSMAIIQSLRNDNKKCSFYNIGVVVVYVESFGNLPGFK